MRRICAHASAYNDNKMAVEGQLLRVCPENSNLVAFVAHTTGQKVCSNALILIGGTTDGFLGLPFTESLSRALPAADYSLVMVNLSSSWYQFGFSSLSRDAEELAKHVTFLKTRFGFAKIALLGHSTGAQDVLYFLRHGKTEVTSLVNGVILLGGVSDREVLGMEPYASQITGMIEEAKRLEADGKGERMLSERLMGAPITANRLLSLAGRLTEDDMFSTDLTENELHPILQCVRIPILLCYSQQDEYVPDHEALKEFAQKMVRILKKYSNRVERKYYDGNHALSEPQHHEPFVKDVVEFVTSF